MLPFFKGKKCSAQGQQFIDFHSKDKALRNNQSHLLNPIYTSEVTSRPAKSRNTEISLTSINICSDVAAAAKILLLVLQLRLIFTLNGGKIRLEEVI